MVTGHKFSLAAYKHGILVGVAIVGRPVAKALDNGATLEVLRVATDGTRNACSALYAECRRRAIALGIVRLVTYTQAHESGSSLRALGLPSPVRLAIRKGKGWSNRDGRKKSAQADFRWELLSLLNPAPKDGPKARQSSAPAAPTGPHSSHGPA